MQNLFFCVVLRQEENMLTGVEVECKLHMFLEHKVFHLKGVDDDDDDDKKSQFFHVTYLPYSHTYMQKSLRVLKLLGNEFSRIAIFLLLPFIPFSFSWLCVAFTQTRRENAKSGAKRVSV